MTAGTSGVGRGPLREAVAAVTRFDRAQIHPGEGARATLGVAVPLLVGVASGQIGGGLAAALGALSAGFASFQGVYRSRAVAVVAASVGMALSTFTGELAGHSALAIVPVAVVWGFTGGLVVSLGQAATVVGLQCVVALLVVSDLPATPGQAATRAGLVLAGGLVQTLLLTSVWPLRRHPAERAALASVFDSLARYAAAIPAGGAAPPEPLTAPAAARTLADPQPFGRPGEAESFQALLAEAERLRSTLAALALHRRRSRGDRRDLADLQAQRACSTLAAVAAALRLGRAPVPPPAGAVPRSGWPLERQLQRQLASVVELASVPVDLDRPGPVRARRSGATSLADVVATLRANLTPRSAAGRHAVRLAVAMGIATALSRIHFVPHGYWLPLTTLVVLKPDFATTISRGIARVCGTVLGAAVATLIAALLRPGSLELVLLVLLATFAGYLLVRANYAAFAVCITAYVVFLLALTGLPELTAVADRAIDTAAGGALAMVVYLAWPTWESAAVGPLLADLWEALDSYGRAVLCGAAEVELRALRNRARLARSNAEASLERMRAEPSGRGGLDVPAAARLVAAARHYALGALALHAAGPPPGAADLAPAEAGVVSAAAAALRGGAPFRPPGGSLATLLGWSEHAVEGAEAAAATAAATAVDVMVEAVAALVEELRRQPPGGAPARRGSYLRRAPRMV